LKGGRRKIHREKWATVGPNTSKARSGRTTHAQEFSGEFNLETQGKAPDNENM